MSKVLNQIAIFKNTSQVNEKLKSLILKCGPLLKMNNLNLYDDYLNKKTTKATNIVMKKKMALISSIKMKVKQKNKWVRILLDFNTNNKVNLENDKEFFKFQSELNSLKNMPPNIFVLLMEAVLYLKINNQSRAVEMLEMIIKRDPFEQIFEIQADIELEQEIIIQVKNKIKELISFLDKNLKDEEIYNVFITCWDEYYDGFDEYQEINVKRPKWSLSDIREIIKRPNLRKKFVSLWFYLLKKRAGHNEIVKYLDEAINQELITHRYREIFWIFEEYLPKSNDMRDKIVHKIIDLWKTGDNFEKDLVLRILKNEILYKAIGEKLPEFKRPLFTHKRVFYNNLLERGLAIDYTIYNLIGLGDLDEELSWWILP